MRRKGFRFRSSPRAPRRGMYRHSRRPGFGESDYVVLERLFSLLPGGWWPRAAVWSGVVVVLLPERERFNALVAGCVERP